MTIKTDPVVPPFRVFPLYVVWFAQVLLNLPGFTSFYWVLINKNK